MEETLQTLGQNKLSLSCILEQAVEIARAKTAGESEVGGRGFGAKESKGRKEERRSKGCMRQHVCNVIYL